MFLRCDLMKASLSNVAVCVCGDVCVCERHGERESKGEREGERERRRGRESRRTREGEREGERVDIFRGFLRCPMLMGVCVFVYVCVYV